MPKANEPRCLVHHKHVDPPTSHIVSDRLQQIGRLLAAILMPEREIAEQAGADCGGVPWFGWLVM